jgi:copper chaperone CopZ
MKIIATFLLSFLLPFALLAADTTAVINVDGNCGMCKKRIEKAANSVQGVEKAQWDKKTHKLTVVFDDATTTKDLIVEAVLKVGYDADGKTANNDAYNALTECCHYRDSTEH